MVYVGAESGSIYAIGGATSAGVSVSPTVRATSAPSPTVAAPSPVEFVAAITGGDDALRGPGELTIGPDGNLYIGDGLNSRFVIVDASDKVIGAWGTHGSGDGQFDFLEKRGPDGYGGIVFDAAGNSYVMDFGNYRVQKFDKDRKFVTKWGDFGSGDGQFIHQKGIAIGPDGSIYVADDQRDDIQKFDGDGHFLLKFGGHNSAAGQLDPSLIYIDDAGMVYVADWATQSVKTFDQNGVFLTSWGSYGSSAGQFNGPFDIAVDEAGNVYVVDLANQRVQVFDATGKFLVAWGSRGDH